MGFVFLKKDFCANTTDSNMLFLNKLRGGMHLNFGDGPHYGQIAAGQLTALIVSFSYFYY